jgi:hypothetical protein
MKRTSLISTCLFSALILMVFCLYPQASYAHTPENIQLEYNLFSQTLKVTITHNTSDPDAHFIKSVEIKKNGEILSTNEYDSQPERGTFTYVYDVSAQEGDTLEVTANCSVYGYKTATLIIGR